MMQVPSAVSAIKIDGVRSYAKVRSGQDVALPPRPVTIDRLEVAGRRDVQADGVAIVDLDVLVECSSGTYVRALARDLGSMLGTGGHLTALRRTRVGPFSLERLRLCSRPNANQIVPLEDVVRSSFATLTVTEMQANYIRNGRRLVDVILPDRDDSVARWNATISWRFTARKGRMPSRRPFWCDPSCYSVGAGDGNAVGNSSEETSTGKHACLAPAVPVVGFVGNW